MRYYAIINGQQVGPVDELHLASLSISKDTLMWRDGMPDWVPAGQIPELSHLFVQEVEGGTPPEMPATPPPVPNTASTPESMPPKPNTYLALSVFVTIFGFCCGLIPIPFGIVAIINALSVEKAYYAGWYDDAKEKSRKAKRWAIWGIIATLAVWFLLGLLLILGMDSHIHRQSYYYEQF